MRIAKRASILTGLLVLLAAVVTAADASGKWKGSFEAPDGQHELTFDLKANGTTVTGTVTGLPKPTEIQDGKLQGDVVSFSFITEYQGNPIKLVCKGQIATDGIRLAMGTEDGAWGTEFLIKKAS